MTAKGEPLSILIPKLLGKKPATKPTTYREFKAKKGRK
ncbi:hypothetical protein UFOVP154_19 [uncultured Caudovirales phage]|uniref:Uncharacterized protein n=1 Tax=uncultured Caudovirales phage TaxID=2100421 RepID=A0A6J5KIU4_9CAUD|nr:hypothetical protein UFOVP8_4 [uncultured Caudovirales phage]CAB5170345.1 hypothetical protein UFOVP154_19 [uncultured Caudovirales phage]